MKQDKALRKTLNQCEEQLPHGFHTRVMDTIYQETERMNKINDVKSIVLASMVSLLLITGVVYLLTVYTQFSITGIIPRLDLHFLTKPSVVYSAYFASIVIVLLTLDLLFRQIMGRSQK